MAGIGAMSLQSLLEPASTIPGVIGAVIVSRDDGLVVAGSFQPHLNGAAVAALAAGLMRRAGNLAAALGRPEPGLLELAGSEGTLLAVPAEPGLLLVAVTARGADLTPARRELRHLAGRVG